MGDIAALRPIDTDDENWQAVQNILASMYEGKINRGLVVPIHGITGGLRILSSDDDATPVFLARDEELVIVKTILSDARRPSLVVRRLSHPGEAIILDWGAAMEGLEWFSSAKSLMHELNDRHTKQHGFGYLYKRVYKNASIRPSDTLNGYRSAKVLRIDDPIIPDDKLLSDYERLQLEEEGSF